LYDHVDVFLDESGDLGFSAGASEHFIVAALATRQEERLARLTRKCRRRFGSCIKGNPEIKFNRCSDQVRRFVLDGVAKTDSVIVWSGIGKSSVSLGRRLDKDAIWRSVAANTLSEVSRRLRVESMHVVVDRRSVKKVARKVLDGDLTEAVLRHHAGVFPPAVRMSHLDSASSAGLRVVDHVAGAVFQSLERGNHTYLEMIESRTAHGGIGRL
jgi:hypothetical protein